MSDRKRLGTQFRKRLARVMCLALSVIELVAAAVPAEALAFSNNSLNNVKWEAYSSADPTNTKIYSGDNSLVVYNRYVGSTISASDWNVNYCGPINPNRLTVMGASGENNLGYPLDISNETGQGGWLDGGCSTPANGILLPAYNAYTASKRRSYLCNASTWAKVKSVCGYDDVDPYQDVTVNNLMAAITAIGQEFADSLAPEDVGVNTNVNRDYAYKATHACLINIMLYEVTLASDGNLYGYPLFTRNSTVNQYMSEIFHRVEVWNAAANWGSMVSTPPGTHRATARFGYDTSWDKIPDMTATSISYTNSNWRVARYTAGNGSNDEQVYLARGFNTIRWKDPVYTGELTLQKGSTDSNISGVSSLYNLAGGVFTVYSDSACTSSVGALTTTALGGSNTLTLNAGTYYIRETTAPPGFAKDTATYTATITAGNTTTVSINDVPISDPPAILLRKVDADNNIRPSGNMSLGGAQYTVKFYGGLYDTAEEAENSGDPVRSWIFETDEDGYVDLADSSRLISGSPLWYASNGDVTFPLGTLVIYESKAPTGYLLSSVHYSVKITEDGADVGLVDTYNTPVVPETPIKGGVCVRKYDSSYSSNQTDTQGDGSLSGAEFSIVNSNTVNVTVNGTEYAPGEVCLVLTTDASGYAASGSTTLPYGSYTISETKAPEGYLLNTEWNRSFTITTNAQMIDLGYVADDVIRGGIQVQKLDSETNSGDSSLSGAVLGIALLSDKSVIVNGSTYSPIVTAEGTRASRITTLRDTEFLRENAVMTITTGSDGTASTGVRDLPYGTYYVAELNPPEGYSLNLEWYQVVEIRKNGELVMLDGAKALVDTPEPVILSTSLVEKGKSSRRAFTEESTILVDSVNYNHLIPGQTYTLEGVLMDKSTGQILTVYGENITASVSFTPNSYSGTAQVTFTFSSLLLDGKSVVAFETLKTGSVVIAEHKDINDAAQTVAFQDENPGSSLPETGGIGTEILYRIGAIMTAVGTAAISTQFGKRSRKEGTGR